VGGLDSLRNMPMNPSNQGMKEAGCLRIVGNNRIALKIDYCPRRAGPGGEIPHHSILRDTPLE
jgi:hypothetical protein